MATPFDHSNALHRELEGASDRAAAIVAGAFLDEVLQELLCEFLIEGSADSKKLFEGTGALATFSAKIEMSYRLGLISDGEHRTLTTIRGIRNDFAHVLGDLSFATQSIQARCRNIEVPLPMVAPRSVPLSQNGEVPPLPKIEKAASEDARAIFQETVITLMHSLAARVAMASEIQRRSPPDFVAAHETGELIARRLRSLRDRYEELLQQEKCPPDEKVSAAKNREKYEILIQVQEFCCRQIKRAHEALRG
ncbi:MAG: hypothetical protein V4706_15335 [Pseudomonadota bacterium]